MIIIIKILERRGNITFWHERTVMFFGKICDFHVDHSHQLMEIFTTVGKRDWRQRVSHCTVEQIFDIVQKSIRNVTFLGIEDYRGVDKCIEPKICRRVKKILSNIKKKRYFENDSYLNARTLKILYHRSRVC